MSTHFLEETYTKLRQTSDLSFHQKVFVGLDGYIDLIQRAVKMQATDGPVYFESLKDFGDHNSGVAGKSAQVELVTQEIKLGGNAPIMAQAMGSLGFPTFCIGNFGKDSIHHVYEAIHKNVTLLSIGDSAMTNALEFHDGKLILSEVGPFKHLDWEYVKKVSGLESLINSINACSLIALVDWCNLPYSTDIWKGILEEIMPKIHEKERNFFFDIADPSRRSDSELGEALDVIGGYNRYGKATLGLNENETEKVYSCLNRLNQIEEDPTISLIEKGQYIFKNISVDTLLIHPTNRSISINNEGISELAGRFVQQPKISTGGGDNFNGGYCLGQMLGLDIESSMITGMANSGSYVQNGRSCTFGDLKDYISIWIKELNQIK